MEIYEESSANTKPRRRWLRRMCCGLLLLFILALCAWAWRHQLAKQHLDESLAELDGTDPGWRLEEIEAARTQIPEEDNSARVVVAAAQLLPKNWPPRDLGDLFTHLAPQEQLDPTDFERLDREFESVQQALEKAGKLAKMPRGRHHIIYERNTLETRLNDQAKVRRIALLLTYDALRHDQKRDGARALTSCQAALNAARSIGDEPITISQIIRSACVIISCQAIERTLAQCEPPLDKLSSVQRALEIEDSHPDRLIIMRGERAMFHELFDAIEDGDVSLNGLAGVKWGWFDYTLVSIRRMNIYEDHVLMLSLMSRAIANAQLPMFEQIEADRQLDQESKRIRGLPRPPILTGLLMPAMSKWGEFSRRAHAYIRCTIIALAAERFRREKKLWPDSAEQLCPHYLAAIPLDPFEGESLHCRRVGDGVITYSISSDEIDNNGNLDRVHPMQAGGDIGIRLWDVAQRRQPPRPKPREED